MSPNSLNFSVRKAKESDLPVILKLFADTVRHTCKSDYNEAQLDVWTSSAKNHDRWLARITGQYFLVAESSAEIVGFASLESSSYIDVLYVHKDYQRQGVASRLLNALILEAKRQHATEIFSYVSITARLFFENKGFAVIRENIVVLDGIELINYRMSKSV